MDRRSHHEMPDSRHPDPVPFGSDASGLFRSIDFGHRFCLIAGAGAGSGGTRSDDRSGLDDHYETLSRPRPVETEKTIARVSMYFRYGCLHCHRFLPFMESMEEKPARACRDPAFAGDLRRDLAHSRSRRPPPSKRRDPEAGGIAGRGMTKARHRERGNETAGHEGLFAPRPGFDNTAFGQVVVDKGGGPLPLEPDPISSSPSRCC